jgi:phage tail-like protein
LPTSASRSSSAGAGVRARPLAASNFLVDFGGGDPRAESAGFAEVVFPSFAVTPPGGGDVTLPARPVADDAAASPHLILRRGVTGALDLYQWWSKAHRGKAPQRRVVKVMLLDEDRETVVWTWRFRNVRPVSLSYSPLRAMAPAVLMETLELAFDDVEIS